MTFTDPRQEVLRVMRDIPMPVWCVVDHELRLSGYKHAVMNVCHALEATAGPDEMWESGKLPADLLPTDNLGEHIAATRRQFGYTA